MQHIPSKWIHNPLPKDVLHFSNGITLTLLQEHAIKDVAHRKECEYGGVKVAGVLVSLDPLPFSNILINLPRIDELVSRLFQSNVVQSCTITTSYTMIYYESKRVIALLA